MVDAPPPVTAATIAAAAANALADEIALVTTAIQNLPDKLQLIARQIQVTGTIIDLIDPSTFTIRTAAGDVTLKLPPQPNGAPNPLAEQLTPFVQNQRPVSVIVQPGSPPAQALLILPQPTTPSPTSITPPNIPPALETLGIKQFISLSTGQTLSAVVLPGPFLGNATTSNPLANNNPALAPLNLGNEKLSPLQSTLSPPPLGDLATPAPQETTPALNRSPIPNALAPRADIALFKPGAELNFRINTIITPDLAPPPDVDDDTPDKIIATVIGKGPSGQMLLNAEGHTLFVRQSSDLPVGSKLLLTLVPHTAESAPLLASPDEMAHALHQLMSFLQQINPQLAQHIMHTRIPRPNAALSGTMLFFLNAFQQGVPSSWLGEQAMSQLDKLNRRDLFTKAVDEFQRASGAAHDSTVGEWRAYPLPLHDHHQFQMLHLYVHQDHNRQQAGAGKRAVLPQTRFLINLNLSRLGALQMDGLSQKKQLDMMIRSEKILPPALPHELRTLYINTLEAVGLTGSINFQTGRQNWVNVERASLKTGVMT